MFKVAAMLVAVAFVSAGPAVARDHAKVDTVVAASAVTALAPSAPRSAEAGVSDRQRYCIRDVPTGSHIERTTCLTRAQWIEKEGFDPTVKQ